MSMFKTVDDNQQCFLKMGLLGFQGSGKTFTAAKVAVGLHQYLKERGLKGGDLPVYFLDSESGSDWVKPDFDEAGIELAVLKTNVFDGVDPETNKPIGLRPAIDELKNSEAILIIDSVTHFWREMCETYTNKKSQQYHRDYSLQFNDWAFLKEQWNKFSRGFVNGQVHVILCGRAGYEYDYFENQQGKKELAKTGIKMKAEGETGHEPSIVALMELVEDVLGKDKTFTNKCSITKDRSRTLHGKTFENPTFETFLPHIEKLNLGGKHVGVEETGASSAGIVPEKGENFAAEREASLDEIKQELVKHFPGQSAVEKKKKADLMEKCFGNRSWKRIETYSLEAIQNGRNELWKELNGKPFDATEQVKEDFEKQAEMTF